MASKVVLYGATGYAGNLIANTAKNQGIELILAGRSQSSLTALANQLNLEFRVFSLDNSQVIADCLHDAIALVNCSGPFSKTTQPLVDACLKTKTHYLDIAGEVPEFENLQARNTEAQTAGIMLLPGVGFGVVPTDCVAADLKQQLPTANRLTLIYETIGGASQGTANTVLPNLHQTGVVREAGKLILARPAQKKLKIDLGSGLVTAVTNPWRADIITAYQTTSIPNIEVYTVFPAPISFLMASSQYLQWLFNSFLFQKALANLIKTLPMNPTASERAQGRVSVMGFAEDETGRKVAAKLSGS